MPTPHYASVSGEKELPQPNDEEYYAGNNRQMIQPVAGQSSQPRPKFCIAGGLGMVLSFAVNQVIAHKQRKAAMRGQRGLTVHGGGCSRKHKGSWEERHSHFERKLERKAAKLARKQARLQHWVDKKEVRATRWEEKKEDKEIRWAERRERKLARRAGRRGDCC